MTKDVDVISGIVSMYNADTYLNQDEIVGYLNSKMRVRFYSVYLSPNCAYAFEGKTAEQSSNSITVSSYKEKSSNNNQVLIS